MEIANTFWGAAREQTAQACREIQRRSALARQPRPKGVSGPPWRYLLGEIASLAARKSKCEPGKAERPRTVMLLPGFATHPSRMRPMAQALRAAGHEVHEWGLGFNMGPTQEGFDFLMRRVEALARESGEPVALVGWSLGGLFAREIANRQPQNVACVITMGSPFSGSLRANNVWRAYQAITGHSVDEPPVSCELQRKPPVPTIALWSPRDGIVHHRSACGRADERDRAIALRCTHLGFAWDPEVIAEVLRQLDTVD